MGTTKGLLTMGNFLLNQRKDANSNSIPKLYKKFTKDIMSTKLMYATASVINVESEIPTQDVLNQVDLTPKNCGKNPKFDIPRSWYAQLLN